MTERTCGTCRWANPAVLDDQALTLQCHRYPPQIITGPDDEVTQCWPQMDHQDWCAEHTPTEDGGDTA